MKISSDFTRPTWGASSTVLLYPKEPSACETSRTVLIAIITLLRRNLAKSGVLSIKVVKMKHNPQHHDEKQDLREHENFWTMTA